MYDVDTLSADELRQLCAASATYKGVFNAAKGALPVQANDPPVTLNFKPGWKHVFVPIPKWGPGATAVLTRWAKEMLDSGLYTLSKSPSASRPHIARKTPPNSPKDVDITQCGIRVAGITVCPTTSYRSHSHPPQMALMSSPSYPAISYIG